MTDPHYSAVSLLLHCDGADGSTTFTDTSPYAHAVTAVGNTRISTAQSKFGGASGYFDGSASRLTLPDHAAVYLGSGDYTLEAWLYIPTLSTVDGGAFVSQANNLANNSNRQFAFFANSSGLKAYWTTDGFTDQSAVFSCSVPTQQWVHVAFARASGVLRAFLNGTQVGSDLPHTATYYNSTAPLCIGTFGRYAEDGYAYLDFVGYLDELRITQGLARYTAAFTPPTAPFPDTGTEPPDTGTDARAITLRPEAMGAPSPDARARRLAVEVLMTHMLPIAPPTGHLRFTGYVAVYAHARTLGAEVMSAGNPKARAITLAVEVMGPNIGLIVTQIEPVTGHLSLTGYAPGLPDVPQPDPPLAVPSFRLPVSRRIYTLHTRAPKTF